MRTSYQYRFETSKGMVALSMPNRVLCERLEELPRDERPPDSSPLDLTASAARLLNQRGLSRLIGADPSRTSAQQEAPLSGQAVCALQVAQNPGGPCRTISKQTRCWGRCSSPTCRPPGSPGQR